MKIHPIHRRLYEIHVSANKLGGYGQLPERDQQDLQHCMRANARLVERLEDLYELSLQASYVGDTGWQYEICARIEALMEGRRS
ncbi:DUF7667 family protein [Paenibacillus ginsengarvi]|uniref:Uncharacterized protein n=1 Tax=Paenibacillus ginsengarvi TaxID=400777 RepID=A0A3B0BTU3_9BACL|nr:hypothetical protein [Paenibacillus ginsengarvi]RKN75046.1 hypothetical protein D7M11_26295 [Paenibacillus ginsengarvi]